MFRRLRVFNKSNFVITRRAFGEYEAGRTYNSHDYHKILELPQNASIDSVKSQFRKLAFKYHPDRLKEQGIETETARKE